MNSMISCQLSNHINMRDSEAQTRQVPKAIIGYLEWVLAWQWLHYLA